MHVMGYSLTPSRLRAARGEKGLTQLSLAEAVGITRQSLFAIESGKAAPSVFLALRLAQALDHGVEELFGAERDRASTPAEAAAPGLGGGGGRVALAHLAGRWVAHGLTAAQWESVPHAADGLASPRGRALSVDWLRAPAEARDKVGHCARSRGAESTR